MPEIPERSEYTPKYRIQFSFDAMLSMYGQIMPLSTSLNKDV